MKLVINQKEENQTKHKHLEAKHHAIQQPVSQQRYEQGNQKNSWRQKKKKRKKN